MNRDVKEITAYIIKHEGIWNEPKRFNAVLLDLLPGDDKRSFRNLLVMSVKEDIPKEMQDKKNRTLFLKKYKNRLMQAMPIREEAADEVISFWEELFNKIQVGKMPIHEMYFNNEISGGLYAYLKHLEMENLSDFVGSDLEYALKNGIAPYQRELCQILEVHGYVLQMETHMLANKPISDYFKEKGRICKSLQSVGIDNLRDLIDLINGGTLNNVKGIGEQSIREIALSLFSTPNCCKEKVVYISPSEEDKEEKKTYQEKISSRKMIVPIWPEYLVNNPYFSKVLFKMLNRWNDLFDMTADQLIMIHKTLPIESSAYKQLPVSIIILLIYQSMAGIWTINDWEKWILYLSKTEMNDIAKQYSDYIFYKDTSFPKTINKCLHLGKNAFCVITRSAYVFSLMLENRLQRALVQYQEISEVFSMCINEMLDGVLEEGKYSGIFPVINICYAICSICGMYVERQVEKGIDLLSQYIDEYTLHCCENAYFLRLSELFKHDSMFGSIQIKADIEISEQLYQKGMERGETEANLKEIGEEITYDSFLATLLCTWDDSWVSFFDLEGFTYRFPEYSINSIKRYLSEDVLCFIEKSSDILEYNKMPINEFSGDIDVKKLQQEFKYASARVVWEHLNNEDY